MLYPSLLNVSNGAEDLIHGITLAPLAALRPTCGSRMAANCGGDIDSVLAAAAVSLQFAVPPMSGISL